VLALLVLAGVGQALLTTSVASAHERRAVGDYTFVVGFLKEPVFEAETNGIHLQVTRGDQPVEGLEKTLKAEVVVGGQTMPVELHPRFRQPGVYNGDFVPTRPGSYTFRFTGNVEGRTVNELFESGPGRFDDVQALAPLQFPDKIASAGELQRAVQAAESRAATATTLGALGLATGLAGLLLAAWALASSRRAPAAVAPAAASTRPTPAATQERL
jgi:hypothetical protein